MTLAQKRRILNKMIDGIPANIFRGSLQDWITYVANIHPDFAVALEGIYCGREGRVHEKLGGKFEGLWLDFGWYTVSDTPRVEYTYVS